MPHSIIKLDLHLDPDSTWALAQFLKRTQWDHLRACASDDEEAELMRNGVERLQAALAEKGFAPR